LILGLVLNWPPAAAWNANRAGLLQTRAAFDKTLTPEQQKAMRNQSEGLFVQALAAKPGSTPIQRRYGLLLMEQARFDEAIPRLELAYAAAPDHLAARKSLGLAYLWTGNLDRAGELLAGLPNILPELEGLAWEQYHDLHHDQSALNAYLLLDQLNPGQDFIREMIATLQNRLPTGP